MVDKDKIELELHWYFHDMSTQQPLWSDQYEIDHQGLIHVFNTNIYSVRASETGRLPVRFGEIVGDFRVNNMGLTTLEGAPTVVSGWFSCVQNKLTSLLHCPKSCMRLMCSHNKLTSLTHASEVDDAILCDNNQLTDLSSVPPVEYLDVEYNPIQNFQNTPSHIERLDITWHEHLPLLGLLSAQRVDIFDPESGEIMERLTQIINAYTTQEGSMKSKMIKCAAELIRAGYKENARW